MKIKILSAAVVCCLAATAVFAQTPAEQLQRAIFAQDAQGNTESAIATYRQLATSTFAPRDVAAYAQYRLSDALLQKGDVTAARRELERMRKDFAEYRNLIDNLGSSVEKASRVASPPATTRQNASGVTSMAVELNKLSFFSGSFVETIRGTVSMAQFGNPDS